MARLITKVGVRMDKRILIIGGGPGGYVAAIRASQLGAKVTLVEKQDLGGTCLNRGCIPTKALYKSAEVINMINNSKDFGIMVDYYNIDVNMLQKRKSDVVDKLVGGIKVLLKSNGVDIIKGNATIKDEYNVSVVKEDGKVININTDYMIIATGSQPFVPPIKGIESNGVLTSSELLEFEEIPESLTVIGGGVIGLEFAGIFNAMGTKVTIVESLPNILNNFDKDIYKRLASYLKRRGIKILTNTTVEEIASVEYGLNLTVSGKKGERILKSEKALISTGRRPFIEGLGLDRIGVSYNKGIKVDENFRTNVKNIYAIGDVIGGAMLAHVASHHGIIAAEGIMGVNNIKNTDVIPSCVYITPEVASVGYTEDYLKDKDIDYKTSKFMIGANGKAITMGETDGFVKIIADESNRILGVHIIAPHASDIIHEGTIAIAKGLKVEDFSDIIHGHPTVSESFMEALMGITGEAIHMAPQKKRR